MNARPRFQLRALGLALAAAGALWSGRSTAAEELVGGLDLARVPLSVRQQSGLGTYGSRDPLAVFSNPALAGFQPHTWEVGAANQLMNGFGQNAWGLAGGWASTPGENGSVAGSALLSGLAVPAFAEVDELDQDTGSSVGLSALGVALAGAYQWEHVALGVSARFDSESYGLPGVPGISAATLGAGLALNIRNATMGAAITGLGGGGSAGLADLGGASHFGRVTFQLGARMPLQFGNTAGAGVTLSAGLGIRVHRLVEVHGGAVVPFVTDGGKIPAGEVLGLRFGATVRYLDWAFDYGLALQSGNGLGAGHLISVGRSFGPARELMPPPAGAAPRFSFEASGKTLAVSVFEPQAVSASDAAVIADLFRSEMIKQGVFQVVEKANMEKVLSEQAFQQSGCTTQECAVKLGKVLNVKFLVVGSFGKLMDRFILNIRVVDVETARAVYSDSEQGKDVPEVQVGITRLATRLSAAVSAK